MTMRSTLRGLAGIVALGASALALSPSRTNADVGGNIKYVQTSEESNSLGSYPEANVFYDLPKGISGYTFVDLYNHDSGYFGRTSLTKDFKGTDDLAIKVEGNHFNEPLSEIGIGLKANIPKLPERFYANVSWMPVYWNNDGSRVDNKQQLEYFARVDLPLGLKLSSFGEWNLRTGNWGYGEIELTRDLGPFSLGYNGVLLNDGDWIPTLEHRASVIVDF